MLFNQTTTCRPERHEAVIHIVLAPVRRSQVYSTASPFCQRCLWAQTHQWEVNVDSVVAIPRRGPPTFESRRATRPAIGTSPIATPACSG